MTTAGLDELSARRLRAESLSTSWLASRLGVQPARLNALRREGKLLAVRANGDGEHLFPAWQFEAPGRPLPVLPQLLRTARDAGLEEAGLYSVLNRRVGLLGGTRLVELLRQGRHEHVLSVVAQSRPAAATS